MTALAHQFAGLISPLHGSFSADRATRLMLRLSPMMLAQIQSRFRPKKAAPVDRAIADSWRGLYGSGPFPSILPTEPRRLRICRLSDVFRPRSSLAVGVQTACAPRTIDIIEL